MPTLPQAYPDVFQGYPGVGYPNSIAELKKIQLRGPHYNFLRKLAHRDVVFLFDDFLGKAIDSTLNWSGASGGGAAAVTPTIFLGPSGLLRTTTGTANGVTASGSVIGPVIYPGTANPGMEIRFRGVTAVTGLKVEAGFIDAVPAANAGGINNMDTPTAAMANGALVGIDTTATANLFNFVTIGSATNQAIKKTNGTTGMAAALTYQTIRVQLFSRDASTANAVDAAAWFNGQRIATHDISATAGVGAVNGSVLLAPWFYVRAMDATSKSIDIDYIALWADRQ